MTDHDFIKDLAFAMECKAQMLKRGSRRARKTCPECGGTVNIALAGPSNHISLACETPNCLWMME